MIHQQIEAKLQTAFEPLFLQVVNESDRHHVPPGSESHFKVTLVSDGFVGKSLLARHRSIYAVLAEELSAEVHALALHTYTREEWAVLPQSVPASPPCRGGGSPA